MAYGLRTFDSSGGVRLEITDETAMFSATYDGSGDKVQAVEAAPTGKTRVLVDHTNKGVTVGITPRIYISGNNAYVTNYGGSNYQFSVYML